VAEAEGGEWTNMLDYKEEERRAENTTPPDIFI
jgi:hypothetical protein